MANNREETPWDLDDDIEAGEALEANQERESFADIAERCSVTEALVEHLMERFHSWEDLLGKVHLMTHEEAIRRSAHYEVLKYVALLARKGK